MEKRRPYFSMKYWLFNDGIIISCHLITPQITGYRNIIPYLNEPTKFCFVAQIVLLQPNEPWLWRKASAIPWGLEQGLAVPVQEVCPFLSFFDGDTYRKVNEKMEVFSLFWSEVVIWFCNKKIPSSRGTFDFRFSFVCLCFPWGLGYACYQECPRRGWRLQARLGVLKSCQRHDLKRSFHFPTINFQGDMLVFRGVTSKISMEIWHQNNMMMMMMMMMMTTTTTTTTTTMMMMMMMMTTKTVMLTTIIIDPLWISSSGRDDHGPETQGADPSLSEQAVLMRSLRDTNVAKIEGVWVKFQPSKCWNFSVIYIHSDGKWHCCLKKIRQIESSYSLLVKAKAWNAMEPGVFGVDCLFLLNGKGDHLGICLEQDENNNNSSNNSSSSNNKKKIQGDDLRIFMALLGDLFPGGKVFLLGTQFEGEGFGRMNHKYMKKRAWRYQKCTKMLVYCRSLYRYTCISYVQAPSKDTQMTFVLIGKGLVLAFGGFDHQK